MSLLPFNDLRALRWKFLGTIPKNRREEWQLHQLITRVNEELAVRKTKICTK
jgi:hypothetical protein